MVRINFEFISLAKTLFIQFLKVQFRNGFRYDQYGEHPAALNMHNGQHETAKSQSDRKYESHPPLGLLNKNRENKKIGSSIKQRLNSLGIDGELRKFQKARNSLRRKNIEESQEAAVERFHKPNICDLNYKNENLNNMRRTDDTDDVDSSIDKKIQKLVWLSVLRKYKQAMDGILGYNADDNATEPDHSADVIMGSQESEEDEDDVDDDANTKLITE